MIFYHSRGIDVSGIPLDTSPEVINKILAERSDQREKEQLLSNPQLAMLRNSN